MRIQNRILAFCSALTLFAAAGIHSFPAKNAHAAETVKLTPGSTYQINGGVFEGWGSSLCWWANRIGYNDTLSKKAAELFYGDSGLRLNIARFNIGGGDNPSHTHITRTDSNMPGYSVYNNGKIICFTKRILQQVRPSRSARSIRQAASIMPLRSLRSRLRL